MIYSGDDFYGDEITSPLSYSQPARSSALSPAVAALVAAKLIDQATHYAGLASEARTNALKDDAKFFQRATNAYAKALEMWQDGARPQAIGNGRYLLPSRTDGSPHLLTHDGDWTCTCSAGATDHWAKAMVTALVDVLDEQDAFRSGDVDPVVERVNDLILNATARPGPVGWQALVDGYDVREVKQRRAAYAAMDALYA